MMILGTDRLQIKIFSLTDHETLMEYLTELPTETSHYLLRTAAANHWNTYETKGIKFVGKLRLTQGLDYSNDEESQSDKSIRDKIMDILQVIPDEFELEENLTEILKLVLDQELQVHT